VLGSSESICETANTELKDSKTDSSKTDSNKTDSNKQPEVVRNVLRKKSSRLRSTNTNQATDGDAQSLGGDSDESSDEGEMNFMVLRQSMCQASEWCAGAGMDSSRDRLSRQALHLSTRASRCFRDSELALPTTGGTSHTLEMLEENPLSPYPSTRK